ncbi:hypothetical protein J2S43_003678 [Catenuloplanes nepalensis]|uniref:SAF domain-containing protein n=1 Tax=Catenuloplanes nepalensis TaxID=587533 RepID=A0ABT9MV84_9ACTN|nr:hypothetical protein [Catenuloplanes nepalensis]MDP9795166.1 hypothetical protein [Catenuloplanes nepalensis]
MAGWSRGRPGVVFRIVTVAVAVLAGAAMALAGTRLLFADERAPSANSVDVPEIVLTNAAAAIASNRLVPAGPQSLFDNRSGEPLAPGDEVNVSLLDVAEASTAVVLAVSALDARQAGAVTVTSSEGTIPALRLAGKGGQTSTTLIVPVAGDGALRVRDEAGGRLVVQLVGTLAPSASSAAGRVVPVPSREVFRLVKEPEGDEKELDLDSVPELADRSISAVMLQVAADVGTDGGFVHAGDSDRQELFWSATKGADRTRGGLMLVPVDGDKITIHYEAGTELRADLVGYVTGEEAPESAEGLLVMVPLPPNPSPAPSLPPSALVPSPPGASDPSGASDRSGASASPSASGASGGSGAEVVPTPVAGAPSTPPGKADVDAGRSATVTVVPDTGLAGVPLDRIGGAFLRVTAKGDGTGDVAVRGAGADTGNPTMLAAQGVSRSILTLVAVSDGTVTARTEAGAELTLTPEVLLLTAD